MTRSLRGQVDVARGMVAAAALVLCVVEQTARVSATSMARGGLQDIRVGVASLSDASNWLAGRRPPRASIEELQ